jgi:hypothetical protein
MSEWFESQKKPNNDFPKLLQKRIDKSNPRRAKLTNDEVRRLEKLEDIATRLKRGENVQNRQLKAWLTEDEYAQIEAEWAEQKELREELKDKPSVLKRYEDKLKEAIMMRNRSDAYHRKGKKETAYNLDGKCESLCEDALEILQEIVSADASLQTWFDRNLDFGHGSLIDANLENLPRLTTSRSQEKQRDDSRIVKKIDVKISVVERAIDALKNYDTDADSESEEAKRKKLNEFLKLDD